MHKDNAVLRRLNAMGSNACRSAVVAAMMISLAPATALAVNATTETGSEATNNAPISAQVEEQLTPSEEEYSVEGQAAASDGAATQALSTYDLSKIADGTYTGTATIPGNEDDEWGGYTLTVNVTVANHTITQVNVDTGSVPSESTSYVKRAVNGRGGKSGVPAQIVSANSASVDVVTTATFSSNAIMEATANALANATTDETPDPTPVTPEYTYGYAALSWSEYWAAEGVQNGSSTASSDEADSRGEYDKGAFDVVTRATTNHGVHRGSYQCTTTIYGKSGAAYGLATWAADGKSFTTTDGRNVQYSRGTLTLPDGTTDTLDHYEVSGLKYVPVAVKTSDLEAFKAKYSFVANGETLVGGYGENKLSAYSVTAEVDANTNGLKTVSKNGDSFSFSKAATGTTSGIKDQALKTATGIEPTVKDASGSYGEFLRVDLNGDYGDLGANMQSVTWTYYGNDSTYANVLATYGTKFAADNWMHKSMGIQLGLTDSVRCQLPVGYNGTGYWKLTVHALGYEDYSYSFQATEDNIVGAKTPVTEATKASLQALYDKAAALNKSDYTEESWTASAIETETAETKELLEKANLGESEAAEQITHLQGALDALVKADTANDYAYGYAGLTWAEYWAAEGVQNADNAASSEELDSKGETDKGGFDVVTRATTNHGLHRGSYQCTTTIFGTSGNSYGLATWAADGKSFTTTDGRTIQYSKGTLTLPDGSTDKLAHYEVSGLKYVPVAVKNSDLAAFKAKYAFVANGEALAGGYGENKLSAYSVTAEVDADTNGLKTVSKNGDSFSFSKAAAGTTSGIKDQALKTATGIEPSVKAGDGSYGEFLRVDLNGDYGDLGANMQSVTWTYYGSDSSRSKALASFGTKFAADNWMHKSMGIQLGLTHSYRCELPAGTDGTGYWTITVHALGYNDYSWDFQATSENIAVDIPVKDATLKSLQELYAQAAAKIEGNYSADSWKNFETELNETKDMLADTSKLTNAAALTQQQHLQAALDALVRTAPAAGSYVLMNIPYSDFYAAETANNSTKVDVFTSATKTKTRTGTLAGGSYHKDSTGESILGITYPVLVTEDAAEKIDWSKYKQVTDSDSVEITTANRGQTSTTTYKGKDALFEADSYSYYILGTDAQANYKELNVAEDGALSFSAVKGDAAKALTGISAELSTESSYGDYELDFSDDLKTAMKDADGNDATVYGVVVTTSDGTGYGMRHLENIWRTTELAWCTGFTEKVHNCPTSSEHYKSMMGKTITSATYYTSTGVYTVAVNDIYVPIKSAASKLEVSAEADAAVATVKAELPFSNVKYSINGEAVEVKDGKLDISKLAPGSYTLVASDADGKYADVSAAFTVSTAKAVAKIENNAVVKADGATDAQLASYLGNITAVTVNGTKYSATGRGAVKIVNADGSINLEATSNNAKVFDGYGNYSIEIASTGYPALAGTVTLEADKTALKQAIASAEALKKDDYTSASWEALETALAKAKEVEANVAASDEDVAAATKALSDAQGALVKVASSENKAALKTEIDKAAKKKEANYTAASWKAYQDALAKANAVYGNSQATDAEVTAATEELANARKALVKLASSAQKEALKTEIDKAEKKKEANYTADSWKAYQEALAKANKVYEDGQASEADVVAAATELSAARKALVKADTGSDAKDTKDNTSSSNGNSNSNSNGSGSNNNKSAGSSSNNGSSGSSNSSSSKKSSSSSMPTTGDGALTLGAAVAAAGAAVAAVGVAIRRRLQR